jgi:hypothetical protein
MNQAIKTIGTLPGFPEKRGSAHTPRNTEIGVEAVGGLGLLEFSVAQARLRVATGRKPVEGGAR